MKRSFNITGACDKRYHYMVDLQPRLVQIKGLIADSLRGGVINGQ